MVKKRRMERIVERRGGREGVECSFGGADETVEKLKAPKEGRKEGTLSKEGKQQRNDGNDPFVFLSLGMQTHVM